jgi:biopolymer transport protein ExbB
VDVTTKIMSLALEGAGWVLWLLIALSVASIAVMIKRIWFFATHRADPDRLLADMRTLLDRQLTGEPGLEARVGAMDGAKAMERMRLERNLAFLATLGSNAPFVGLLGTVLGIIKAFHDLSGAAVGGPGVVMAGISQALVATAVGLGVAIPAVVAFNYFNRRVRSRMVEVDWMAQLALARLNATTGGKVERAGGADPIRAAATSSRERV